MSTFRVGERVALKSCTDFPGTVTGFVYGKVQVQFDDLDDESLRAFRPESLQPITRPVSVPETLASGTRSLPATHLKESAVCKAACDKLFGTKAEKVGKKMTKLLNQRVGRRIHHYARILIFAGLSVMSCLNAQAQNIEGQIIASQFGAYQVPGIATGSLQFEPSTCQVSGGGKNFSAFTVGVPIKIVDSNPNRNEIDTPVAVFPNQCAVSMTTTYIHATPFHLTSGTGGLQEAIINGPVKAGGPNTIILNSDWYAQVAPGNPASVIAAVHGTTSMGLIDVTKTPYVFYSWNGTQYAQVAFAGGFIPATNNVLKGTGSVGSSSAATPGTDYLAPGLLPNGTTAVTQSPGDNSTKLATTAYVGANGGASTPATTNVYKGTGSVNGVTGATPGTDYVIPSGTVANLSGTPTLPNGTAATTQTTGDNTTKLATDAFVLANAGGAAFPGTNGLVFNTGVNTSRNATPADLSALFTAGASGCTTAGYVYSPQSNTCIASSGNPGGSNQTVQFNNSSAFGGDSTFTFNNSTKVLNFQGGTLSGAIPTGDNSTKIPTTANVYADMPGLAASYFGAYGDAIKAYGGCSITVSTATLNCGGTSFVSTDVGKQMWVPGAGAAGVALNTTIASVTNSGTVVLTDAAITSASSQVAVYGHDDVTALQSCFNYSAANSIACVLNSPTGYLIGSGGLTIAVNAPNYTGAMNVQGASQTKGTNLFCEFNGDCLSLQAGPVQGANLSNVAIEEDPTQPNGRGIHLNATPSPGSSSNPGGLFNSHFTNVQVDNPAQECIWFDGGGGAGYAFNLPNQYINLYNFTCNGPNQMHTANLVKMTGQDAQINFIGGAINGQDPITNYPNPMIAIQEKTGGLNDAPEAIEMLGWTYEVGTIGLHVSQATNIHYDNGYVERVATALDVANTSGFTFNGNHLANTGFTTAVATFGPNTNGSFRDNVIFGNSPFVPLAMAVCTSNNGFVDFAENSTTTTATTGCATIQQSPSATFNVVGTTAFVNGSGTPITTINAPNVMPGKTLTLYAAGTFILGSGGNINLGGLGSPLTIPTGSSVTLQLFDLGPTWLVTSATAGLAFTAANNTFTGMNTFTGTSYFPYNSSPAVIALGPAGTPASFTQIFDDGNFHIDGATSGHGVFIDGTFAGDIACFRPTLTGALVNCVKSDGSIVSSGSLTLASARKGTFTCTAGGTITIANANEQNTSDVVISLNAQGGTISTAPAMNTVTAGTGFTVLCGAADTSVYNYDILN